MYKYIIAASLSVLSALPAYALNLGPVTESTIIKNHIVKIHEFKDVSIIEVFQERDNYTVEQYGIMPKIPMRLYDGMNYVNKLFSIDSIPTDSKDESDKEDLDGREINVAYHYKKYEHYIIVYVVDSDNNLLRCVVNPI